MGKKMKKLSFLSKINTESSSWPWPAYCHQPRTLSFRTGETMFKTTNSAYLDATNDNRNQSCYFTDTSSDHSPSFSTTVFEQESGGDCVEAVIKGLRSSERLFFEPGESNSILEEAKVSGEDEDGFLFKESLVLSMESQDPYVDFKKSMEEMVEAHGLKDWEGLEELLCCYLRVNGKSNHGYIVRAFVELLVGIAFSNDSSNTSLNCTSHDHHHLHRHHHYSPSSPLSFYTSTTTTTCSDDSSSTPCVSSLELAEDDQEEVDNISPCLSSLQINEK